MGSICTSKDVERELPPFLKVYKDGTVERLSGNVWFCFILVLECRVSMADEPFFGKEQGFIAKTDAQFCP